MKSHLTGIALAAMLLALPTAVLRAQGAGPEAGAAPPVRVAFSIANVVGAPDVEKLTTTLTQVKGVTQVAGLNPQSRMAIVTYLPAQVSVQQIAQGIADTAGVAGKLYQASLLIRVVNLSDAPTKEKAISTLKRIPGVAAAAATDANAGIVAIQFAPLAPADKTGGPKGATQEQITKTLADAGLEIAVELVPAPLTPPAPE